MIIANILGRPNTTPTSTIAAFIRHAQQPQRNQVELENTVPINVDIEPLANEKWVLISQLI